MNVVGQQPGLGKQMLLLHGDALNQIPASGQAIISNLTPAPGMHENQVQVVKKLAVRASSEGVQVRMHIVNLIFAKSCLHFRVGHGVMLELGIEIMLHDVEFCGTDTFDRVVLFESFGNLLSDLMLQAALHRTNGAAGRYFRKCAEQELAGNAAFEPVFENADAVFFGERFQLFEPVFGCDGRVSPEDREGSVELEGGFAVFGGVEGSHGCLFRCQSSFRGGKPCGDVGYLGFCASIISLPLPIA